MNNEQKIVELNNIIKEWNNGNQTIDGKPKWFFTPAEISKQLNKLYGYDNQTEFATNCLKYLSRNGSIDKMSKRGYYFGFVKSRYYSPINEIKEFDFKAHSLSDEVVSIFDELSKLDFEFSNKLFSEESLFTTIIEYSTLNEINIDERSKNIADVEVIEKNNIENLYRIFTENEIRSPIDENALKNIHSRLMSGLAKTNRMHGLAGKFTEKQNYISGGYVPCLLQSKDAELSEFIKFFNKKPDNISEAIVRVAIISYWFAGIHIFEDGNSRTGRFLLSYYMYLHGFTNKMNFTVSKAMNTLGGKDVFINYQVISWNNKSLTDYVDWFVNTLINNQWQLQTNEKIKQMKLSK